MWIPEDFQSIAQHPSSTFLVSAWHELFFGFTPDSHQPRLHNSASLVEELVDMGERWKSQPKYQHQIIRICAELESHLNEESDLLSCVPSYRTRIRQIIKTQSPSSLVSQGRVLVSESEQYWHAFRKLAIESVSKLPRGKHEVLTNIRRLATFALQQGKEDDDVWNPLNKDVSRSPEAILRELVRLSGSHSKQFRCTLTVVGDVDLVHSIARKEGLSIVARDSLPDDYRTHLREIGGNLLHVQVMVPEVSIRNAVAKARKILSVKLGLVSLYANPESLRLHPAAVVSSESETQVFIQSEQAFRRLHPRTKSNVEIGEALQLLSSHRVDRRVLSAVEQLSLASASSDTRTKLVNLWASVETLAGVHEGETAMERVGELIVPLIISRHVHRAARYLAIQCQRYGDTVGTHNFGSGFRVSRKGAIRLDDMLVTLASPCGDPKIVDLLRFAEHPLLRFRIYRAWEKFNNPKTLRKGLLSSKQRLEWQLARIYRARNLLVHEGEEVRYVEPLLDNLQNYLSMVVQRALHELKNHPDWSLRELIEYWRGRMMHCLEGLNADPTSLSTRDFLEQGDSMSLWLR